MAKFRVRFVDDDQLPDETEWAVARCADGQQFLFVKRRACAGGCGPCSILAEARRAARLFELEQPAGGDERLTHPLQIGGLVPVGCLHLRLAEDLHHQPIRHTGGFE